MAGRTKRVVGEFSGDDHESVHDHVDGAGALVAFQETKHVPLRRPLYERGVETFAVRELAVKRGPRIASVVCDGFHSRPAMAADPERPFGGVKEDFAGLLCGVAAARRSASPPR